MDECLPTVVIDIEIISLVGKFVYLVCSMPVFPQDCMIFDRVITGPWTKEEEEELTRIVTDMTIKQGRDIDNDVFWSRVSQLMGGRRGRQQCRIKWYLQ